ncbi:hypothetical protein GK3047 [Geobacillus kaustophilus HTA426]|uniref:Uncharacterized protein n=2 Tax=Geobacillus thermoleovorans group TaxID=1505648 RepID=Q5KVF4_GEOKA|nr:Get2 [Geobacillus thermoleovorans]BAD77332.1 hypothetical protein GK3047 [Geobacillus kaustophilus HTA426]
MAPALRFSCLAKTGNAVFPSTPFHSSVASRPIRSGQIRCDFCQAFVNDFIDFLHLSIFWLVFF